MQLILPLLLQQLANQLDLLCQLSPKRSFS
jgi:hypothetical protein